jgi:hypothetical protein
MAASAPLAREPFDKSLLLVAPGALFMLLLFVYPFLYGLWLSFTPKDGGALANYAHFFTTDNLWPTIWTTLKLALPATLINVGLALPIAFKMRLKTPYQRVVTTILVVPITLGTVLIAEGMLIYFGPKGWLAQFLQFFHLYDGPIRLTHNFTGRADLARRFGLSVRVPADPVVHHGDRSRPREGGRHSRAQIQGAIPANLPAAARARASRCASALRSCRRSRCSRPPCCWDRPLARHE